jgi:hypothetical protein
MEDTSARKQGGLLNMLLETVGLKRSEPASPSPVPVRPPVPPAPTRPQEPSRAHTSPGLERRATQPLSQEEKTQQSEERQYLIAAFLTTPNLIPEFQNPQYMYKLISNEREFVQEQLNLVLQRRKELLSIHGPDPEGEAQTVFSEVERQAQRHRDELTRLFILIKRVTGIQKSGTGGTHFFQSQP